jgi:lysophospholipase L1-like esterase
MTFSSRRNFLIGAGTATLLVSDSTTAQEKRATTYERLVASRARMLLHGNSSQNRQTMARSAHIAAESLTAIRVAFSGFHSVGPYGGNPIADAGVGADTSLRASIEYPVGEFAQLKFRGSPDGIIPDAGVVFSDYVPVKIPATSTFWVRKWTSNPIAGAVLFNPWQNRTMGESFNIDINVPDLTMGGEIQNRINWSSPPLAILGMSTNPSVIIIGDSIAAGYADTEDRTLSASGYDGKLGVIARSLGSIPFLNLAVSGENAYSLSSNGSARNLLIQKGSHLICELGLSDLINHGRTVPQIIRDLRTVYSLARQGQKILQTTWTPRSQSSDKWITINNQTVLNNERTLFNRAARSIIPGSDGTVDIAGVLESAPNSGKWVAAPSPPYTVDGVHPSPAGYALVAAAGIIRIG